METTTERSQHENPGAVTEGMKSTASAMAEKAKRAGERMGEAWQAARTNVQEKTLAGARATDRAIHDYPYASLGVAFGLGLIIGILVNRGRE